MSQIEVVGWMLNLDLNYDNGGESSIPLSDVSGQVGKHE
jgi:hypothetical protein